MNIISVCPLVIPKNKTTLSTSPISVKNTHRVLVFQAVGIVHVAMRTTNIEPEELFTLLVFQVAGNNVHARRTT